MHVVCVRFSPSCKGPMKVPDSMERWKKEGGGGLVTILFGRLKVWSDRVRSWEGPAPLGRSATCPHVCPPFVLSLNFNLHLHQSLIPFHSIPSLH